MSIYDFIVLLRTAHYQIDILYFLFVYVETDFEFNHSQASFACTIALGNLIVIVVAKSKFFDDQACFFSFRSYFFNNLIMRSCVVTTGQGVLHVRWLALRWPPHLRLPVVQVPVPRVQQGGGVNGRWKNPVHEYNCYGKLLFQLASKTGKYLIFLLCIYYFYSSFIMFLRCGHG